MKTTKKLTAMLLSVIMAFGALTAVPLTAGAVESAESTSYSGTITDSGLCGTNVTYALYDDGTLVISGTGDMDGYGASYGLAPWENSEDKITSVVIGNGVTNVGQNAFSGCDSLVSATIPDSVTNIGSSAFLGCTSLTSITIPDSVIEIGSGAFYSCKSLASITIPDSVTSIGDSAFYGTVWFDNQPNGVVYAGKVAYGYKGDMPENTSITLKSGTKEISGYAFNGCTGLASITIPDSVTSIGDYTFYGCENLTSVNISENVGSVGRYAFDGTAWYDEFYGSQQDGVLYLGKAAYVYKGDMPENTSITLKDGTKGISDYAFNDCTGLTNIKIPNSVVSIGDLAFCNCSSLTSVTIPDGVTSIGDSAFDGCGDLTSVTIGNGVTSINRFTFSHCYSLTDVEIPDSVVSIGYCAFRGCSGLTSVTLSDNVTSIAEQAFDVCNNLKNVTIPSSVRRIGSCAFGYLIIPAIINPKLDDFTITGYANTAAETYANENGFEFVALDETTDVSLGDVSGDGTVDISDATAIQKAVAKITELTDMQTKAADVNGDGTVDISDATMVQKFVAQIITEFQK